MGIKERIERIEQRAGLSDDQTGFDLTLLTDDELRGLAACYDSTGKFIAARFTPELETALARAASA